MTAFARRSPQFPTGFARYRILHSPPPPTSPPADPPVDSPTVQKSDVPPWSTRIAAYRLLWIVGAVVLGSDLLTKYWIVARIPFSDRFHTHAYTVIDGFFYLVHVGNTGAAWSMFSGRSGWLALFAATTLMLIFVWRRALGLQQRLTQFAFGLLCGGIIGNLIDRLRYGHVVDFVDLHFGNYVYPTFNVADSGICIGVGLYLIHSLRQPNDAAPSTHD